MVLSQVDGFIQCEVVSSEISLDSVQPLGVREPWLSPSVLRCGSRYDHLGICVVIHSALCPNKERYLEWIIAEIWLLGYPQARMQRGGYGGCNPP